MTDEILSHFEITGRRKPEHDSALHAQFIDVKINGKKVFGLQQVDIHISSDGFPIIILRIIPKTLEIDLDGVKTKVVKS